MHAAVDQGINGDKESPSRGFLSLCGALKLRIACYELVEAYGSSDIYIYLVR